MLAYLFAQSASLFQVEILKATVDSSSNERHFELGAMQQRERLCERLIGHAP
jgi:hypothetical protein